MIYVLIQKTDMSGAQVQI